MEAKTDKRMKRPYAFMLVAASLDGKIASPTGDSRWITNERSRRFVHRLRWAVDAVLVGVGTVLADDPHLTPRIPERGEKNPLRVILDTNLRTPLGSQVVRSVAEAPTLIATGPQPDRRQVAEFQERGVEVLALPIEEGRVSPSGLLRELGSRQITSLLVEGGAEVHGSFFRAGLVDKVYFFYAPKIIGGRDAVPLVGGRGVAVVGESLALSRLRVRRFEGDIMVEAYVATSPLFTAAAG